MNSIDYQSDILERFIPVSIDELVANLMNRKELSIHQKNDFQLFCQQYRALYQAQS
jgi:hypothetical protein